MASPAVDMGIEGVAGGASRIVAVGNLTPDPIKLGATALFSASPVVFLAAISAAKCEVVRIGMEDEAAEPTAAVAAAVVAAVAVLVAAAGANKATRTKPTAVKATAMHTAMANSRKSQARSFLRVTVPVARPRMMRTADWLPALPPDDGIMKNSMYTCS